MSNGITSDLDFDQIKSNTEPSQQEIIQCLCEAIQYTRQNSENFNEFINTIDDTQDYIEETFNEIQTKASSLERFVKKKASVKNKLQDRINRIEKFKSEFETGLSSIGKNCPPGQTILSLMDQFINIIKSRINKIDRQVQSTISSSFDQLNSQFSQLNKLTSLMESLRACN